MIICFYYFYFYKLQIIVYRIINFIITIGLVYKKQEWYEDALECFWKLRNIVRYDPLTLYQISHLYQLTKDVDQSLEWYSIFIINYYNSFGDATL